MISGDISDPTTVSINISSALRASEFCELPETDGRNRKGVSDAGEDIEPCAHSGLQRRVVCFLAEFGWLPC